MVYGKVGKGMYGLSQSGKLAHDYLVAHLALGGYFPTQFTSALFTNRTNTIQFALIVDDFGVKYTNQWDFNAFVQHLQRKYSITKDDGIRFNGITLRWDYINWKCELFIPDYNKNAFIRLKHPLLFKPQHSPYPWTPPKYCQRIQYAASSLPPSAYNLPPDIPIVQAATGYTSPDGQQYILVFNEAIYMPKMDNSLLNPNQLRHY